MTVITLKGSNGIAVTDPADQDLIKSSAMSTVTLVPSGGTAPYVYSVYSGALPAGVSLNPTTGAISGTPTAFQNPIDVRFLIEDNNDGAKITGAVSFNVADTLAISNGLDSIVTIEATKDRLFEYQLYSTGGLKPVTWTRKSGTWPTGMSDSDLASDGSISGTPTAIHAGTALVFTGTDANSTAVDTATVTLVVNDALTLTIGSLTFTEDVAEAQSFIAVGGTEPITFELADGDLLPDGLIPGQDGIRTFLITGTVPTGTGSASSFQVDATDANGDTDDSGLITILIST